MEKQLLILLKMIKNFDVVLLTTNTNYVEILKQVSILKPRNLVINNIKFYEKIKKKLKKK